MMKEFLKSVKANVVVGVIVCMAIVSCEKESANQVLNNNSNQSSNASGQINPSISETPSPCGAVLQKPLMINAIDSGGFAKIFNDQNNLYVSFTTSGGWLMASSNVYAGKCNAFPMLNGEINPQAFVNKNTHSPAVSSFSYQFPLSNLDSCLCVAVYAKLVKINANGVVTDSAEVWAKGKKMSEGGKSMYNEYCRQACSGCVIKPGDFRTQTQGGWGAAPHGNNPGVYLHANFAGAFPNGLTIGCNNTIKFTSAQAITDFLPSGGSGAAITQNYINPTSLKNVLAGQVLTLTLSVEFDKYDANFSASTTSLGSLVITSGTFAGWSINNILAEANKVLGGCASAYTASQINSAITSLNENFDDGTMNGGFVACP